MNCGKNEGVVSTATAAATTTGPCFRCQMEGHWVKDCPNKPNSKTTSQSPPSAAALKVPPLHCPCGAGICIVRTSKTDANPGRLYYTCPATSWRNCKHFCWCDSVTVEQLNSVPQTRYPMCPCGAGVCPLLTVRNEGPNYGRKFFVCPVKRGQGSCGFIQWQKDEVKNPVDGHANELQYFSPPQSTLHSSHDINTDSCQVGDFCNEKPESVRSPAMEAQLLDVSRTSERGKEPLVEKPNLESTSEVYPTPEHYDPLEDTPLGNVEQPEVRLEDSVIEEAFSRLASKPGIRQRQAVFCRDLDIAEGATSPDSSALATVSFPRTENILVTTPKYHSPQPINYVYGQTCSDFPLVRNWLGSLAFPPARFLSGPTTKPLYSCDSSSFMSISIPQDVDESNLENSIIPSASPSVADRSSSLSLSPQPSCGDLSGSLGLRSPPGTIQVDSSISELIRMAFEDAATRVQNDLLTLLESMDPLKHEPMVREANSTFVALDRLSVDYRPFYDRVTEFIKCAPSFAAIERTICDDVSSQELVDRCNREKDQFAEISRAHKEVSAKYSSYREHLESLHKEAERVRDLLHQVEEELACFEVEAVKVEAGFVESSENLRASKQNYEVALEEGKEALQLWRQREEQRDAAKAALEKARLKLLQ